jgi:hypothetical protein
MKIIYLSVLSLAIIGQGTYFYLDHQAKIRQTQLAAEFRAEISAKLSQSEAEITAKLAGLHDETTAKLSRLEAQTDNAIDVAQAVSKSVRAIGEGVQAVTDEEQRLNRYVQESQQKNESMLNMAIAAVGDIEKFKDKTLAQVQENETQLGLLKKEQVAKANFAADKHWRQTEPRHVSDLGHEIGQ